MNSHEENKAHDQRRDHREQKHKRSSRSKGKSGKGSKRRSKAGSSRSKSTRRRTKQQKDSVEQQQDYHDKLTENNDSQGSPQPTHAESSDVQGRRSRPTTARKSQRANVASPARKRDRRNSYADGTEKVSRADYFNKRGLFMSPLFAITTYRNALEKVLSSVCSSSSLGAVHIEAHNTGCVAYGS